MTAVEEVANWEIFVWALSELDGAHRMVDVEEVFFRSFEIAPRRLSWRTRPDLPDYKKCAKSLRDAEARRPALLIKTGDRFGRQLTVAGQEWVAANAERLRAQFATGPSVSEPRQRPSSRMLAEVEESDLFQQWMEGSPAPSEKWRVADLFRCSPDSSQRIWVERLQTLRSAAFAANRNHLLRFLDQLQSLHPDWFGGVNEA
jgi:hypothetical protein